MPKRVLPEGTTETIARLTREGWSASRIAEHLHVAVRTVIRHRKRAGVAARRRDDLTREQIERIELLVGEGMPSSWVAEDVGCSRETVRRRQPIGRDVEQEFRRVFARIGNDPALLELHRQFAPREGDRAA